MLARFADDPGLGPHDSAIGKYIRVLHPWWTGTLAWGGAAENSRGRRRSKGTFAGIFHSSVPRASVLIHRAQPITHSMSQSKIHVLGDDRPELTWPYWVAFFLAPYLYYRLVLWVRSWGDDDLVGQMLLVAATLALTVVVVAAIVGMYGKSPVFLDYEDRVIRQELFSFGWRRVHWLPFDERGELIVEKRQEPSDNGTYEALGTFYKHPEGLMKIHERPGPSSPVDVKNAMLRAETIAYEVGIPVRLERIDLPPMGVCPPLRYREKVLKAKPGECLATRLAQMRAALNNAS